jgi:nucleotide-binding universal stress UspA family protein
MKSIIVPTDFSDTANNAVQYAAALCKDYNLELHLLHAIHIPAIDVNAPISLADTLMDNERKSTTEKLQKVSNQLVEHYGIAVSIHSDFGLGSDIVIDKSVKIGADMIVMGTSGESGFIRGLLGSVTAGVVGKSEIPVLAIPNEAVYAGFKVAVLGKDNKESIRKEMVETYQLIKKHGGRLDVVSVEPGADSYTQEVICEEGGIREVSVWDKSIEVGLQNYMDKEDASLLVLKHHSRNIIQELFQKSTTKELLKECTIPLYVYN